MKRGRGPVLGKVYHVAVAVCAVGLTLVLILGALFVVVQGLFAHVLAVDLWTPVAEALGPVLADLAGWARELWSRAAGAAGALWQELLSWIEDAAGSGPGPLD